jgi:ParB/RepB/Spo0J family partition protein
MSTTTTAATTSLKLVPLEQIRIPEGANPRQRFDERALQELADSIAKHGVLQPLVVQSHDGGGYTLIAGERRYRAAKLAGLEQVPVIVRDGDDSPLELAVDENLHREDLDPIEEAHAFQAILNSGRISKKQLAERVSKSASYVNERLRLLGLPDAIQAHVATGTIPIRLAKQLIEIAKASEPVANACVQLVANGVVKVEDLEQRPQRLIGFLGDYEWADPQPIALGVSSYHHYDLESLPLPAEGCDDICQRYAALGEEVGFRFDQADADAARSYGCLLEFKDGNHWSSAFITDPVFIADRVRQKLDNHERETKNGSEPPPARTPTRPSTLSTPSRSSAGRNASRMPRPSRRRSARTSSSAASCSSATTPPRSPHRSRSYSRC